MGGHLFSPRFCPDLSVIAGRVPQVTGAPVGHAAFSSIVCEGGYPEARLRSAGRPRTRWFSNYIDTTLERDLHELAEARRVEDVGRLLNLLATQSANLVNYSSIGQRLGMDHKTVKAYTDLLEQMFLIQRLPAWRPGLGAREATTPKVYVCDSGLLAYLLGAEKRRVEDDDQVTGQICETVVAAEIMKHCQLGRRSDPGLPLPARPRRRRPHPGEPPRRDRRHRGQGSGKREPE